MKIVIEIDTKNAACEDDRYDQVNRILGYANKRIIQCLDNGCLDDGCLDDIRVPIKDINENRVGVLEINF